MSKDGMGHRGGSGAVGWAVLFAALTSVGLVALAWFLATMDVLVTIGLAVVTTVDSESGREGAPILDGYGRALALGIGANLVGAVVIALLARRTVARSWASWVTGLGSAGLALLVAVSVQLIALGISPVEFVTAGL